MHTKSEFGAEEIFFFSVPLIYSTFKKNLFKYLLAFILPVSFQTHPSVGLLKGTNDMTEA